MWLLHADKITPNNNAYISQAPLYLSMCMQAQNMPFTQTRAMYTLRMYACNMDMHVVHPEELGLIHIKLHLSYLSIMIYGLCNWCLQKVRFMLHCKYACIECGYTLSVVCDCAPGFECTFGLHTGWWHSNLGSQNIHLVHVWWFDKH